MGVSIHYKGRIINRARIQDLHHDLIRLADQSGWGYQDLTRPDEPEKVEIILDLHSVCEHVFFLFDSNGYLHPPFEMENNETSDDLWCSVKTQYAPIETHVALVGLLRFIRENYGLDFDVIDEGRYWETGNLEALQTARDFVAEKMVAVSQALGNIQSNSTELNAESVADLVEEAVKQRMNSDKRRLQ